MAIGQVKRIELYRNDVVVSREGDPPIVSEPTRGKVTEFSKASRKRLAFVASNTDVEFTTMITLTYPGQFPTEGTQVKRHLRNFLDWIRKDQQAPDYLWFLEFQARGAPHIHILLAFPWPRTRAEIRGLRHRVSATWYRIVASGDPRHLQAGTSVEKLRSRDGGARYAVKYAQKMRQKKVPEAYQDCGRFWGHSRNVKPQARSSYRCTEDDIRGVLDRWKYYRGEDFPVYRVLYNQSAAFAAYIDGTFDNDDFPDYNPAQPDWWHRVEPGYEQTEE